MKYIISFLFVLAIVISCTSSDKKSKAFSKPDDIKADEYVVNTDRDTTIETKNGALLKIPKGSLSNENGNTVTLEIKEAYSVQQMIQAGLLTESNGEPLSSGGMIYINAKGGQNVKITQAIKVAVPTEYLDTSMRLYKGEKDANGNINWKEPKALPKNKQFSNVETGKSLFQTNCASCHAIGKDATGPNLAHYLKWLDGEQKQRMYHLHAYYIGGDADDLYSCNLIRQFGSVGTPFENLTRQDHDKIYRYIQNESNRRGLRVPEYAELDECIDSCYRYNNAVFELKLKKDNARNKRSDLIKDNGQLTEEKRMTGPSSNPVGGGTIPLTLPVIYDDRVSPENNNAVYYQFSIETFGWYNVDVLLKDVNGNQKSELMIRMIGQYREKLDILLIIPSSKIYTRGGPTGKAEGEYVFVYKDGNIYLPQAVTAYILAIKETESSIAFAIKEFTTSTRQELEMTLQESTKEVFNKAVSIIGNDRMKIEVTESKNADEIRKTDTTIKNIDQQLKDAEKLRPKRCDCNCGIAADTTKRVGAAEASQQ